MKNTTQNTAKVATLPTTSKPQTAKEVIAANVKLLIEQLEAGHSEALTAYLSAMGKFRKYSLANVLEIARQMPQATRVAGLYTWNQLGRKVNKGSKGIRILAPMIGIRRNKDEEAEKDIRKQNEPVLVGFRPAYVFDISVTTGSPLPEFTDRVTGEVGAYRERLIDFILAQGIDLEFKESIAPALGMCYDNKLVILPGQTAAAEFGTLIHELAHFMLHRNTERRTATTTTVRETEAEAIAFVISTAIGLENSVAADYIALYHGNAALLAESLEVIKQTSSVILTAIEPPAVAADTAEAPAETAIAAAS